MSESLCACQSYCETHGREYVVTFEGKGRCSECMADGWGGELCSPCPDSCSGMGGVPDPSDEYEMMWMCEEHKAQKIQFIQEIEW